MIQVLREQGHHRIIYYMDELHIRYYRSLQEQVARLMPDINLYPVIVREPIYYMTDKLLDNLRLHIDKHHCTAACSPWMDWTQKLLSGCAQLGIRVPKQLSIVSVEHRLGEGEAFYPKVSAFYVPTQAMGSAAAKLLLSRIDDDVVEQDSIEFETQYIKRDSIGRGE